MINGKILRDSFISASNNLANHKVSVDELNVFPVPDGDTGTNMSMTMSAAAQELSVMGDDEPVSKVAKSTSSALLRGARGNSGVILSLLFRGFSKALVDKEFLEAEDLYHALRKGVDAAYKAVMKPTEGTMLTVARESAEHAEKIIKNESDPAKVWDEICKAAHVSLDNTPNLLPVLKKAGVVDAGGMGIVYIFEGMLSVFKGDGIIEASQEQQGEKTTYGFGVEDEDVDIEFPYCTEYIVLKDKTIARDPESLQAALFKLGNSVVFVDDDDIIKIHVHTKHPGTAFEEGLKYGSLINMKIENMIEQFNNKKSSKKLVDKAIEKTGSAFKYVSVDPSEEFGFVAVCAGDGIHNLFSELGVSAVVSGGQTMNPSTDDILAGVHSVPAKNVFVLPNNKNIIMAAEQTIPLSDRRVFVLPTKTIPQGLTAMLTFDPSVSAEENLINMQKAAESVSTGLITYAARDSEFDGKKIKKNEILALDNGKVSFSDPDIVKATVKLVRQLVDKNSSFITIITGDGAKEDDTSKILTILSEKLSKDIEINVVDGKQPVYHYIISVE